MKPRKLWRRAQPLGRFVGHHDAVLHRRNTEDWSEGKSVEVSPIESRARGRVEVGCVLADLLERVGIEGQVEVAVLRHDPSGCMGPHVGAMNLAQQWF